MSDQAIKRISVVGAGLMGHGIAQEFALAGYRVTMHARTQASLTRAEENIQIGLDIFLRSGQTRLGARMHGHAIAGQGKLLCNTMAH